MYNAGAAYARPRAIHVLALSGLVASFNMAIRSTHWSDLVEQGVVVLVVVKPFE